MVSIYEHSIRGLAELDLRPPVTVVSGAVAVAAVVMGNVKPKEKRVSP